MVKCRYAFSRNIALKRIRGLLHWPVETVSLWSREQPSPPPGTVSARPTSLRWPGLWPRTEGSARGRAADGRRVRCAWQVSHTQAWGAKARGSMCLGTWLTHRHRRSPEVPPRGKAGVWDAGRTGQTRQHHRPRVLIVPLRDCTPHLKP